MPNGNNQTIKESLFSAMERIAALWPSRNVTILICAESETISVQSMVGYRNNTGCGTILYISAPCEYINNLLATAWDATNQRSNGGQGNSQQ